MDEELKEEIRSALVGINYNMRSLERDIKWLKYLIELNLRDEKGVLKIDYDDILKGLEDDLK